MAAHTPGPWHQLGPPDVRSGACDIVDPGDVPVARTFPGWQESAANARLIAAAPDLLAELRVAHALVADLLESEWVPADDTRKGLRKDLAGFDAAIAKAEGRA